MLTYSSTGSILQHLDIWCTHMLRYKTHTRLGSVRYRASQNAFGSYKPTFTCCSRISRTYCVSFMCFIIIKVLTVLVLKALNSCCICLSLYISDPQIVVVEMFLVWLTIHCLMRVLVGGTPLLAQGTTAQMAFLPSRSTLSQRRKAQQNI